MKNIVMWLLIGAFFSIGVNTGHMRRTGDGLSSMALVALAVLWPAVLGDAVYQVMPDPAGPVQPDGHMRDEAE